jgi:hypothetical protein
MWIRIVVAAAAVAALSLFYSLPSDAQTPTQMQRATSQAATVLAPRTNTNVRAPSKLPAGLSLRSGKLSVGGNYSVQVQSSTVARLNNKDGGEGTLKCEGCCSISWNKGTLSCTITGDCGCSSIISIPLPKAGVMAR